MHFLPVEPAAARRMEELGWQVPTIPRGWSPEVERDVPAIDFSGWPLYTRADLPDEIAYRICQSLDAARRRIPLDSEPPVGPAGRRRRSRMSIAGRGSAAQSVRQRAAGRAC